MKYDSMGDCIADRDYLVSSTAQFEELSLPGQLLVAVLEADDYEYAQDLLQEGLQQGCFSQRFAESFAEFMQEHLLGD